MNHARHVMAWMRTSVLAAGAEPVKLLASASAMLDLQDLQKTVRKFVRQIVRHACMECVYFVLKATSWNRTTLQVVVNHARREKLTWKDIASAVPVAFVNQPGPVAVRSESGTMGHIAECAQTTEPYVSRSTR